MIISSGYNISGPEVENALLTHPGVAECAVIGVPDAERGQLVKAFVVPAEGVEACAALARELQEYAKSQLAPYKYPRAVKFMTSLPRTLTGKLQRYRLRMDDSGSAQPPAAASRPAAYEPAGWNRPIGYSNAVSAAGRTVFVAGQVGWNPATSRFESEDLCAQVRQALKNVVAALAAAGAQPDQITRLTWFITDRDLYRSQREPIGLVYREIMGRHFPAMSMVVVEALIEPAALVEIEATAVVSD
jgi:enamine deaminase RidA (YjgF/YER057c/UK114 family)